MVYSFCLTATQQHGKSYENIQDHLLISLKGPTNLSQLHYIQIIILFDIKALLTPLETPDHYHTQINTIQEITSKMSLTVKRESYFILLISHINEVAIGLLFLLVILLRHNRLFFLLKYPFSEYHCSFQERRFYVFRQYFSVEFLIIIKSTKLPNQLQLQNECELIKQYDWMSIYKVNRVGCQFTLKPIFLQICGLKAVLILSKSMFAKLILNILSQQEKLIFSIQFSITQQLSQNLVVTQFKKKSEQKNQLLAYLTQVINLELKMVCRLRQISMIFLSKANHPQEYPCLLSLRNSICKIFVDHCRFITGCKTAIEPCDQEKFDKQKFSHPVLIQKNIFQWNFLTELLLQRSLKCEEFKYITLHPYRYLRGLQLINISLSNKMIYYLSRAKWPNLAKLNLKWGVKGFTADAIKYLAKHCFQKLEEVYFRAEIGSELSLKMAKVHSLDRIQINETYYTLQLFIKQSSVKSIFLKQLVKNELVRKYLDLLSIGQIQNTIRSQPYSIVF